MNITTKRKSNIELLRILCMMSLVAHHFTIHGNLYLNENIFVQRFSLIFAILPMESQIFPDEVTAL